MHICCSINIYDKYYNLHLKLAIEQDSFDRVHVKEINENPYFYPPCYVSVPLGLSIKYFRNSQYTFMKFSLIGQRRLEKTQSANWRKVFYSWLRLVQETRQRVRLCKDREA